MPSPGDKFWNSNRIENLNKLSKKAFGVRFEDVDVDKMLNALDAADCEESLSKFVQGGWKYIDPNPYLHGWHLDAIAEHLAAVTTGEIRKLIINIPPRTSKSSMVSVAFPAWTWAQKAKSHVSGPGVQFLFASYAQTLSIRDSTKTRRLIESPWYQQRWGDRFAITSDQNTKIRFDNNAGGYRLATSVGGALTGEGGSIIIVDDPHNAVEMESELVRNGTLEWWDNSLSTRLNNPKEGAYIVIMQRLHEEDLAGHILEASRGEWTHLCLPMRYESDRSFITTIGWEDPRSEEGELLCPDRFGEEEVENLERQLGPFQAAGQLQQRPEPKGGGIIKRDWWRLFEDGVFPPMDFIVASLDTAYTEKTENDPSAMTVWGVYTADTVAKATKSVQRDGSLVDFAQAYTREYSTAHPKVVLMNAWEEKLQLHDLVLKVADTCRKMKVDRLLIENKATGITVAQELQRLFAHEGFAVQLVDPKSQDKTARLYSVHHIFAEGLVSAPDRSWADKVITQCASFPKGKHDDLVDTTSQALRYLRTTGLIVRSAEHIADVESSLRRTSKQPDNLYGI